MSKPLSGLFRGTRGERSFKGDAEEVIASRVEGLDLREHPIDRKQLSGKRRKALQKKVENRTATREEYEALEWDKRFNERRRRGVRRYWKQERERLARGEKGTRNWTEEQKAAILDKKVVRHNGKTLQAHHSYSASRYPHLADRGEVMYPATPYEHLYGRHGGNYKNSYPGKRVRKFHEF